MLRARAATLLEGPLVQTSLNSFASSTACFVCQKRFKKRRFTPREDDLIQQALDDDFGPDNAWKDVKRVKQRIENAWYAVAMRTPHICEHLMEKHGLEKTGEDVFERGRRAVIYYECNAGSEAYVAKYFDMSRLWLSHRLGEELKLKTRPKFTFEPDGMSAGAEHLLRELKKANQDIIKEKPQEAGADGGSSGGGAGRTGRRARTPPAMHL